ncbi:GntR family transcriptional regulator [Actinophytocola gossypii]|uniref:GntR family transcriptional regulator n=1 Tax=Actinophytocola gossypii TaxID=2812003 RepID=A0ABT2J424_9PSEU|nr:GntR family transcriptional regulator [Actinophytocola gossypii]MCT2582054.1 GntR family transcriptional regulator [Actinophytocola gossypii]
MANRPEAAYQRLGRTLRDAILRGGYAGGVRLPTEAELAAEHGVSRQTVRRAFHDLVAEGLVQRVPGRGTFAAPRHGQYLRQFGSVEDLLALSLDTQLRLVDPLRRQVDVEAASRLRLDADAVHRVRFRRLHHDVPFCLTTVYLPPDVGDRLAALPQLTEAGAVSDVTVIGLIDEHTAKPIAEAEQSITAVAATTAVAEHLGCAPGDPLLRVDRTYLTTDGTPVELAISHFLPEHYSYRVRLRRGPR